MTIPFVQIDAFASKAFEGNQACVMPLEAYLPDEVLQKIAAENNVAETAFLVPAGPGAWELRWFTPAVEVPLCGHATLASGHYIYNHTDYDGDEIRFGVQDVGQLLLRGIGVTQQRFVKVSRVDSHPGRHYVSLQ